MTKNIRVKDLNMNKNIHALTGARVTYTYGRIGGLARDLPDGWLARLEEIFVQYEEFVGRVHGLVDRNRIFIDRMRDVGVITTADALSFGCTGPILRSTGVPRDLRKDTPYLGTFSKVLAPGLRLGYVVAPPAVFAKLVQAKQAADLHTPGFNQRIVHEIVRGGFLDAHVPTIRARYRVQRDAMAAALRAHLPSEGELACRWRTPGGGMFFWVELPEDVDSEALLAKAVERGVAFVPGAPFFAGAARRNTMRLSFVTLDAAAIGRGVAAIAAALRDLQDGETARPLAAAGRGARR
jgi:hypothetical protein